MSGFQLPFTPLSSHFGPSDATNTHSVPYAPYSKSDKIGRVADWTQDANRQEGREGRRGGYRGYRDPYQAYGSGGTSMFGYGQEDDEASFSIVDSRSTNKTRLGGGVRGGFGRGRGRGAGGRGGAARGGGLNLGGAGGRGGGSFGRGGAGGAQNAQGGRGGWGRRRGGWKDWDTPKRIKESSVTIKADWRMLEEIEFNRLAKLNLEASAPTDMYALSNPAYHSV